MSESHKQAYDVSMGVEVHLTGHGLNAARKFLKSAGWQSRACPGTPNPAGTGIAGGMDLA